jgi:hypothetical protein
MYNGYPTKAQWNVSLWLNNDEGMYQLMLDALKQAKGCKAKAAKLLQNWLPTKTPDGHRYSFTGIMGAMDGMD